MAQHMARKRWSNFGPLAKTGELVALTTPELFIGSADSRRISAASVSAWEQETIHWSDDVCHSLSSHDVRRRFLDTPRRDRVGLGTERLIDCVGEFSNAATFRSGLRGSSPA
jgi:hypothetical protein